MMPDLPIKAQSDTVYNISVYKADQECTGITGTQLDLGDEIDAESCARACVSEKGSSCKYFIFGKGPKAGTCWWESASGCESGDFQRGDYDVWMLTLTPVTTPVPMVPDLPIKAQSDTVYNISVYKADQECTGITGTQLDLGDEIDAESCARACVSEKG